MLDSPKALLCGPGSQIPSSRVSTRAHCNMADVDFKTSLHLVVPIVLRAEVRDFYTGQPRLNIRRSDSGQHNVVVSGGIVLRF
jgi:hypothetical protein